MKKRFSVSFCLLTTLGLSGCALFPAQFEQSYTPTLPTQWVQSASINQEGFLEEPSVWWKRWSDEDLLQLIEATLSNNTDILVAQSNLRSAQANVISANSVFFPSASVGADASQRRTDDRTTESYGADAGASWSLNFGGRDLANRRVASLNATSRALLLEETKNAMTAEVASTYVRLCLAKKKFDIAKRSLQSYEEAKQLTQWRHQAGLVEATDAEQAIAQFESAKASVASFEHAIFEYQTALSRLTLLPLEDIRSIALQTIPVPPTGIAVSIPANVLEQRPDVQAAKQDVVAAMENIRVAQAAYWPTLSLSGSIGTTAATVSALGASGTGVGALVAALSMPILNWGDIYASTEKQKANLDKVLAQYRQKVVDVLSETENALSAMKTSERRQASLARATQSSELAAQLALQQYSSGLSDYQTVLSTQRSLLNAQETQAANMADWAIAHINLYKTLGGGWKPASTTGEVNEEN